MASFITDPHDFCRACRGKGHFTETTPEGRSINEPCWQCGGTGNRSVRVSRAAAAEGKK